MNIDKGFRITKGRGFQVTFDNGHTVSVQFGPCNYGSHYNTSMIGDGNDLTLKHEFGLPSELRCGQEGASEVETAVIDSAGSFVQPPWAVGDYVQGYQSPADVLKLMTWAAAQPAASA